MTRRISAITIAVVLLTASAAWAADIFTPALNVGTAALVFCVVLNTGTKTAEDVTITIRDGDDNVRATETNDVTPRGTQVIQDDTPSNSEYCQVSGMSKSTARVTLCLADASGTCTVAVTAP